MKTAAPIKPPYRYPVPPSTSMIISSAERWNPNTSMPTNCVVWASSAPAMPAIPAPIVYTATSLCRTDAPIAGIRRSPSRMPLRLNPNGERTSARVALKTMKSTARL